ncbi:MAG: helix-turn-helix domain-containing protein [Elusimicrobiota bacterium]
MARTYKHMTQDERDRLSLFKAQGKTLREMARLLERSIGTLSREFNRNAAPVYQSCYLPHRAQQRSDVRKALAHERKRLHQPHLRAYACRMLRNGWSPERIAGRWKELGNDSISHEAIYQWVYAEARHLIP